MAFRVLQNRNPEILIKATNMSPIVEQMYRRVKSRKIVLSRGKSIDKAIGGVMSHV